MDKKNKISVAIATYNEESNLAECLKTVAEWVGEIVVVDGGSTDQTLTVAKKFGAKVVKTSNPKLFHINKVKAIDECSGEWILQLDADERVSQELAEEISAVITMSKDEIMQREIDHEKQKLFTRHQELIELRDGLLTSDNLEIVAFFLPRINYFLGGPIRYAGTYPDGVIRLFKRGYATLPAADVHEQMKINGQVAWLMHDLIHLSNPTLSKYLKGAALYTDLSARSITWGKGRMADLGTLIEYMLIKPWAIFINLYFRHKGILDGWRGLLFSIFSALHYPVAIIKRVSLKL